MTVTLTPFHCQKCNHLVAYEIRAGETHAKYGDPYECSGLAKIEGDAVIIGPLSGQMPAGFVAAMRHALRKCGIRSARWERIKRIGQKHIVEDV